MEQPRSLIKVWFRRGVSAVRAFELVDELAPSWLCWGKVEPPTCVDMPELLVYLPQTDVRATFARFLAHPDVSNLLVIENPDKTPGPQGGPAEGA